MKNVIDKMIEYFGSDARRINHALKVYGFAQAIAQSEGVAPEQELILQLSAILHDIGIPEAERKYHSTAGKYQEMEGPPIAQGILKDLDVESKVAERVCYLIGHHHSYGKIDGVDYQILVEADFLVNIFEDEMEKSAVESIRNKYFKTQSGIRYIENIYLDVSGN